MKCELCPIGCQSDRSMGETGACGAGKNPRVARAALHFWEEPCISGDSGSGAVFFSGCTMKCVFCQNSAISRGEAGEEISVERLAEIYIELQQKGAKNINLVTPTPYVNEIIQSVGIARKNGLAVPIIYNTSGYERVETLKRLEGTADVYLPDLKYMQNRDGLYYSGVPDYCDYALPAIEEMYRQTGKCRFDEHGYIISGVIARHLILPGRTDIAKDAVDWLIRFDNNIYVSLMNQYTPFGDLSRFKELNRKVTAAEYDEVTDYAVFMGIENGFVQEDGTAEESFIPPFNSEGVLK